MLADYEKREPELKKFEEMKLAKKEKENKDKKGKDKDEESEEEYPHVKKNLDHLKGKIGIEDFWSHVITTHPSLDTYIYEKDKEILRHVKSLFVEQ